MAIYLIRHGLSEGNNKGIYQGGLDFPLTKFGRMQAQALGRWLNHYGAGPARIFTSPQTRALQTAEELAALNGGPPIEADADLREFNGGKIEGLKIEEAREKYPEFEQRSLEQRCDMSDYGGDSYEEIHARLARFIAKVQDGHRDENVLVVSHGGTLHQLLCRWCGWPTPRHFLTRFSNCCCHKLEITDVAGETLGRIQWFVTLELIAPDVAASPVNPGRF